MNASAVSHTRPIRFSATFEYDTRPPVTHSATKAVKSATKALRPGHWRSCVLVLESTPETV